MIADNRSRHWLFAGITTVVLSLTPLPAMSARFWVLMRDGEHFTGEKFSSLYGESGRTKIDGKPLLSNERQVRIIRESSLQYQLKAPFVEFTNGDVLAGSVVETVDGAEGENIDAHFVVQRPAGLQLPEFVPPTVAVHSASVKRIAWTNSTAEIATSYEPGLVRFRNGRTLKARSIQWSSKSLRALSSNGIVEASFTELADVYLLDRDVAQGAVSDAVWRDYFPDDVLVCMRTIDGSQVTFPRRMVFSEFSKEQKSSRKTGELVDLLAIQPSWARSTLFFRSDSVVSQTFRDYHEVPVAALPLESVRQKPGLYSWAWQRNRNLQGGALRSGGLSVDMGVATHGDCELVFRLPTGAELFSSWVGLDRQAGRGGCVQCAVFQEPGRKLLWQSGLLHGSDKVSRAEVALPASAKQLALTTDSAHAERPPGTDPFDIRDHVDWLLPMVKVSQASLPRHDLTHWIPQLATWQLSPKTTQRVSFQPVWNEKTLGWETSMMIQGDEPLEFTRRIKVSLTNAFLPIEVRHPGGRGDSGYEVYVLVDGQPHGSTMNGHIHTPKERKTSVSRVWILGAYAGKEVTVSLVVKPLNGRNKNEMTGLVWDHAHLRPLVKELPESGDPIRPDVFLTDLMPESHSIGEPAKFQPGFLTDGRPLKVRNFAFAAGIGVPTGSEITYRLQPEWRRFVAVIGMADGWKGAGPYQILLDGELHWSNPNNFARNDQAKQINVKIPSGHETITMRIGGTECFGAWANAGFIKQ